MRIPDQLLLEPGDIADAEELQAVRQQVADNGRDWEKRLRSIDTDLEREPKRIRRTFAALQTPPRGAGRSDRPLASGGGLMQWLGDGWEGLEDGPILRDQRHIQLLRRSHELTVVRAAVADAHQLKNPLAGDHFLMG